LHIVFLDIDCYYPNNFMGVAIDRRTENGGTEKKQKPRHPLAVSLARVQIGKAAGIYARLQDNLLTMHRLQALDTLVTRFVQNAGGFDITATGSGDSSVTLKPRGKVMLVYLVHLLG
jgi:hypothetical protein